MRPLRLTNGLCALWWSLCCALLGACSSSATMPCNCGPAENCIAGRCEPANLPDAAPRNDTVEDSSPPDRGVGSTEGACGTEGCGAWFLPAAGTEWTGLSLRKENPFAPVQDIRAAFDVANGEAYVLTDASYHVVRFDGLAWVAAGSRDVLFPQVVGVPIVAAYSEIPSQDTPDQQTVILFSAETTYTYDYDFAQRSFTLREQAPCCGPAWEAGLAPDPSEARAMWLDFENASGWATRQPSEICGETDPAATTTRYLAVLTGSHVHLFEAGYCRQFSETIPATEFSPFVLPNSPSPSQVAAAFFVEGLGLAMLAAR